ncbi:nuclear transport factor 2 family protein [Streptantibioticus ferralitis]|uniref:Nuclear transport factor 2 family protein n=1 Tax=Streptantibioticus ferralitis TaxID=236510 RepID=A0ABT5YWM0_9ACTN|nr:nuclear transport factor 2 family protein [Streptantibioticus ferralitis]MDF2255997.1 nuclear transport factor 2 family protein [Streptantibioticus ferralitis]
MTDIVDITQLVLHERQGRDRSWWDQMRACFAPDATVRLSWFRGSGADFVTASQEMTGRGEVATHRLSPPVVHQHGDRAVVELPAAIEMRTVLDGTEVDLTSYARLLYRVERREGGWQIVSLDSVYERDVLTPALPGATLVVDHDAVAAFRRPYRLLAYTLTRRGYQIGDDLFGDDRPREVAALYDAAHTWLANSPG